MVFPHREALAMCHVGAGHEPRPHALQHLLTGELRPAGRVVALITHLIKDNGLMDDVANRSGTFLVIERTLVLYAGMGKVRQGIIDVGCRAAMYGKQMMIRVGFMHITAHAQPVVEGLGLHQVPFVGHRPP